MTGTIVFAGSRAQKPRRGGHTWVFLQYLLGFRRLGWDVLYLDAVEPDRCFDEDGRPCSLDDSVNLKYFLEVMRRFELEGSFALLYDRGERFVGLSRKEVVERTRNSAFLINVMGFLEDEEILAAAPRRVFLDIDPGFGQMWHDLGLADVFRGHHDFITIGENIGKPQCEIPTCGLNWIRSPQPVVLEQWPVVQPHGDRFTTIASWRGAYGPLEYKGKTYGLRVHEFRQFAPLPQLGDAPFELALDIHPEESRDLDLLQTNGWSLADPKQVARDPWRYREYIQNSLAEFTVAKSMYVQTRSGWFSDRSICYLASGRPVLIQDTGLDDLYPVGEGLLTYNTLEEAAAGAAEIRGNYARHARAARDIAEGSFDSDKVLSRMLQQLGVE